MHTISPQKHCHQSPKHLRDKYALTHTLGGVLLFGGSGLGSALGGIGALCFLCVAHTLGPRVTGWIGAASWST